MSSSPSSFALPFGEVLRDFCRDSLERIDRVDDFFCGHNGIGVIWNIDVESGVHLVIRIIRGRVFYHRDLVAKLSGVANCCFHTRVCYEPDDDEPVDAMLFELQIQIRVSKSAGTPMLERHDVARLRYELSADLATPRPVFEGLARPGCLLDGRDVLPSLVVAWTVAMMQRIENANFRTARSIQDLQ